MPSLTRAYRRRTNTHLLPYSVVAAIAFVAAFIFLFWPTFLWMAERFDAADSFYSHGWLVPFASGWLIWQRRERLRALDLQPSFWGLALLAPSLITHLFATWLHVHVVSGLAMVGAMTGLCWTIWGVRALAALRFPLLFLLFMVPLPGILLIGISFRLKLMAAAVATKLITLCGVSAAQAGSTIHLSHVSVIVDDTCSGLRSLISLAALATLWTALMPAAARWKKLTIVAASIPIALAANVVRIVFLVLIAVVVGPAVAEGFIHYWSGIVVFGIALLLLAWLSRKLA